MARSRKQKKIKFILTLICLAILAFIWFVIKPMQEVEYEVPNGTAEFHFIDVGQGDAILIKEGSTNVLVDTGDKDAKDALLGYLDEHGVEAIDYFIITHFVSGSYNNFSTWLYGNLKTMKNGQWNQACAYNTFFP